MAEKSGARMGKGNDLRWKPAIVFDPFPFPVASEPEKERIRSIAEQIDAHLKDRQNNYTSLTLTGIYNVLSKLPYSEPLTDEEKTIHEQGLVSVLKQLHDDLDAAVFDAYGWPRDLSDDDILRRLVDLNRERRGGGGAGTHPVVASRIPAPRGDDRRHARHLD